MARRNADGVMHADTTPPPVQQAPPLAARQPDHGMLRAAVWQHRAPACRSGPLLKRHELGMRHADALVDPVFAIFSGAARDVSLKMRDILNIGGIQPVPVAHSGTEPRALTLGILACGDDGIGLRLGQRDVALQMRDQVRRPDRL